MKVTAAVAGCTLLVAFCVYLAGDVAICDQGEGCGPGFPEWLWYTSAWVVVAGVVVLLGVFVLWLVRRLSGRRGDG